MYYFDVLFSPALGKANELRTALEERTRQQQAAGIDSELDELCAGPEPGFGLVLRFDDLSAFGAYRDRMQKDTAFQQYAARVGQLITRPPARILWQDILDNTVNKPWEYLQIVTFTPGVGHLNSLAWELRERLETRHKRGRAGGLYASVLSGTPQLALVLASSAIGEIQELAEENRNDPSFLALQDRISPLLSAPAETMLMRTLVRFQKVAFPQMAAAAAR